MLLLIFGTHRSGSCLRSVPPRKDDICSGAICQSVWRRSHVAITFVLSVLFSLLFFGATLRAQTVLVGSQIIGSNLDSDAAGVAEAFPVTAAATGQVNSMNFFLDESSTAKKVYVGIYNDSNGSPGTLLTQGSTTQLFPGTWNTATVSSATITSGTSYWIAILGTTSGKPYFYDQAGSCTSQTSSQSNLASLPSTWSKGKTWSTCSISAYAVSGTLAATVPIGNQVVEANLDKNPAQQAEAFPNVSNATGTVTAINLYLDSTSGSGPVYIGLYADNGKTHPGTLLGSGSNTTPVAGSWNSISITPSNITAGSRYWIAILGTQATSPYFRDRQTTACHSETSSQTNLTAFPTTWTTGKTYSTCYISAYGVAGSGSPILSISPTSLSFSAIQGGANPAPANLSITNSGSGTLTFTDSSDQPWLSAAPASGTAPQTLQISAAVGSLTAGSYTGHVTVTATGAQNSPATATVTFTVAPFIPPSISASLSPTPNSNGWNNTPVTVTFTCTPGSYAIQTCPTPAQIVNQVANQQVTGTVVDVAGHTASTSVNVSLETALPAIQASVSPSPNARGWNTSAVTVSFTCTVALSSISQCPQPQVVSTQGANQPVSATVTDAAGNTDTAQVTVNISTTRPTIVASASPAPNSKGWNNTPPTVSFVCNGPVAPIAQCPAPQQVTRNGTNLLVSGTVTDFAGATASGSVSLNVDTAPPLLNITSPVSGTNYTTGQVTIQGLVSDALSGVQNVNCGMVSAVLTGGAFSCNVALAMGSNTIAVTATDVAGNTATSNITLMFVTPINVQITSPTALQLFSTTPITVTGNVGDPTATVTVGGVIATTNGGSFSASGVVLQEGNNLLTASATTTSGGVGADSVSVILDTTPPTVHIDSPINGAFVTSSQIDVTGAVNDMVTGTVNGDQVSVVVNGVNATVANRSFAAHGVLLVPGQNTITALATDRAGNTNQSQVQVTLRQQAGQVLSIVSGNDQTAPINTLLPQPLVVLATNALGQPMPNVALNFSVLKSDGFMIAGQQKGRQLTIQTGSNGQASVQFQLGSRNGAGVNQVSVSAPGFVGQTVFSADSTVGAAAVIHTVSGESQMGAVGVALAEPLVAIVFDAGGNPVANVPVTFTVQSGGGVIGSGNTFTTSTDGDGKAYAVLVLGQQEGVNNNTVTAAFPGMPGKPAVFVSSGVVPGPAANTVVSGLVLDDTDQPIPNATASIKGTNLSALTNAQGQFTITNVPVGDIVLYVNGGTSTSSFTFPTLSFQMATVPGVNNTLGHPVYLPALDTANSQVVGGNQAVQLTMTGVPGLVYTVAPNSVTFPDGTHVGTLTLSQVHGDRVPMAPPNGTAPRLVGTLQPAGVLFNPPIQMQLPNTDGLAPGQVAEIFSFHHDLEQFVVEGTARVSEDGSVLVTDPGFGLSVSGWHGGGGNNQPPTCGDSCGACKACNNGSCAADATQVGQTCMSDDGCVENGMCDASGTCNGTQDVLTSVSITAMDADNPANTGSPLLKVAANDEDTYPVIFQAVAANSGGDLCPSLDYDWDYGDGVQEANAGDSPSHDYAVAGVYTVTVTAHCGMCTTAMVQNTMTVGIATVEEVDTTVHATPQPNAALLTPSYHDDPPYQAFLDSTQNTIAGNPAPSSLILPLGISPVDMECITTPDYSDPTFGTKIQALQKWDFPQDGSMSLSATSGAKTTISFTADGISQVSCFLDAAGTGQVSDTDSSVPVDTEIATVAIADPSTDVDVEVHSNLIRQYTPDLPQQVTLLSGALYDPVNGPQADFAHLYNNAFNFKANITLSGVDDASVDAVGVVFAQDEVGTGTYVSGLYPPSKNLTWRDSFNLGTVCPPNTFTPLPTPILDAGPGVNGGATPSTSTGGYDGIQVQGALRTILFVDDPNTFFPSYQSCDQAHGQNNELFQTNGGYSFSTYLVAWSAEAPHSYAVIGRAGWTVRWNGTIAPVSITWVPTAGTQTQSTGYVQYSTPQSGQQISIEVNPPVANDLSGLDGTH